MFGFGFRYSCSSRDCCDVAIYFDPLDPLNIAEKMKAIEASTYHYSKNIQKGIERVKTFSWEKMAKDTLRYMKVALVYDRVNKWGGAERVLLALHKLFPHAPLYTSVYDPHTASWAKEFRIKTSFLQSFPGASSSHELYPLLMPLRLRAFRLTNMMLYFYNERGGKGIMTKPKTMHICYCLTPTRYLWRRV